MWASSVHSMEGKLNTIVTQAGLMFLPELDVWSIGLDGRTRVRELGECEALPRRRFTPSELYTAMGFPITEAAIDFCCGVTCCLSRGAPGAFRSSKRSVCHQCGRKLCCIWSCRAEVTARICTLAAHASNRLFTGR